MGTGERKIDTYENLLYRMATSSRYGHYLINVESMTYRLNTMDETQNVWKELRTKLNKDADLNCYRYSIDIHEKMLLLLNSRLSYLQGKNYDIVSLNDKKKYISNIDNYSKFFSQKTIDTVLSKTNIQQFMSEVEAYGHMLEFYAKKGYLVVGDCYKLEKEKDAHGRYTGRELKVWGKIIIVPDTYQNKEGDFLRLCMELEYPYIRNYALTYYHLDKTSELYIKVKDKGVLYIPMECFKTKSIKPAITRMTEYFNWYYKDTEQLKEKLGLMDTNVFKQLKRDIES